MLKIYNTLSRSIEQFKPISTSGVSMYSCGPTVYDYQHIGHMRRYVGDDILIRVLKMNGYDVKHAMNITDVGHLVSDADTGEDKMEKGAKKFGKSVWEIAKMFEEQFKSSCESLNINLPKDLMHATDYIKDQIELIQILEEKGFTYQTSDGIYFDTSKFPNYTKLSGQKIDELKAGARVEMGEKKNPTDFALWKFSPKGEKRQMEWDSPWGAGTGAGFPGWHIECSAMSIRAFGPSLDIHTGGIDHIAIHHTNEIAQSEAATGKEFVKYWVHHNFLLVENQKMSKSLGNIYTVQDVIKKGFDSLSLRYLYLQTHYRQEMNFTWEALQAAQNALKKLREQVQSWQKVDDSEKGVLPEFENKFLKELNDDLNAPQAVASMWELMKSHNSDINKYATLSKMDEVLGLDLFQTRKVQSEQVPEEVLKMLEERNALRKQKRFHLADALRNKIKKLGYEVLDDEETGKSIVKKY